MAEFIGKGYVECDQNRLVQIYISRKSIGPNIYKSQIYNVKNTNVLDDILERYYKIFDSEVGKIKDVLVKIPVLSETKFIFHKARPVPYATEEKVENE